MNQCRICSKKLSEDDNGYSFDKEYAVFTITLNGPAIYIKNKSPPIILAFRATLCFDCAGKIKDSILLGR